MAAESELSLILILPRDCEFEFQTEDGALYGIEVIDILWDIDEMANHRCSYELLGPPLRPTLLRFVAPIGRNSKVLRIEAKLSLPTLAWPLVLGCHTINGYGGADLTVKVRYQNIVDWTKPGWTADWNRLVIPG